MNDLTVTEFGSVRVLTTQQLAGEYETTDKVISNNFNNNKDRYHEGKHFILLTGNELKEFKSHSLNLGIAQSASKLYLWTKKGAFLHAKSLNTDRAWEVYDRLVDSYFDIQNNLDGCSVELQAIMMHDKKIVKMENRMDKLEYDIPLYGCESDEISSHVKRKGVKVLGGKNTNAYRDNGIRSKVYVNIYTQLKREFIGSTDRHTSYKAMKRKYIADAHELIDCYEAPVSLQEEIDNANAQMSMC